MKIAHLEQPQLENALAALEKEVAHWATQEQLCRRQLELAQMELKAAELAKKGVIRLIRLLEGDYS